MTMDDAPVGARADLLAAVARMRQARNEPLPPDPLVLAEAAHRERYHLPPDAPVETAWVAEGVVCAWSPPDPPQSVPAAEHH